MLRRAIAHLKLFHSANSIHSVRLLNSAPLAFFVIFILVIHSSGPRRLSSSISSPLLMQLLYFRYLSVYISCFINVSSTAVASTIIRSTESADDSTTSNQNMKQQRDNDVKRRKRGTMHMNVRVTQSSARVAQKVETTVELSQLQHAHGAFPHSFTHIYISSLSAFIYLLLSILSLFCVPFFGHIQFVHWSLLSLSLSALLRRWTFDS